MGYKTEVAPCKTFHRAYDISHFCSREMIATTRLCRNYRVSHNFSLSPNQACSIDTSYWGSFAFSTSCPADQLSALYTAAVYTNNGGIECTTKDELMTVGGDMDSLDKCAL